MVPGDIKQLVEIFTKICNEFKAKIDFEKLSNKEYFIRQKININYSLVSDLFNYVSYIDSSQFVSRLYTECNNNIGVHIEPFKKINSTIMSKILFIKNNQVIKDEIFIY